jgi:Rrf2 family nitric oxide-sensitive transcriptional repressor
MRLTTYTDHTPRALIRLALPSDGLTTIADSVDDYEISGNEPKALHQRGVGYVETVRGTRRATINPVKIVGKTRRKT